MPSAYRGLQKAMLFACALPAQVESPPDWPPYTSEQADSRSSSIAQWTDRDWYTW